MTISSIEIQSEDEYVQEYNREFRNAVLPVTILFGVEIVLGLLGNSLTIYVFLFRYRPCNFRYFVLSLALTDFICCITTIPGEMVSQLFWYAYPIPAICKIKVYFNQFTICSEASFLTIIAIDRYRKICRPFGWQIRKKTAIYTCVGMFTVSAMLAIQTPIFWGVHVRETEYHGRNITVTVCETDEKYLHTKYPLAFTICNGTLVSIALLCMFVLYILIARRLFFGHHRDVSRGCVDLEDDAGKSTTGVEECLTSTEFMSPRQKHEPAQENTRDNENGAFVHKTENCLKFQLETQTAGRALLLKARRRTLIGFYLTVIFIITTVMLYSLVSVMANGVLATLDGTQKVVFFFFLRIYFLNHVINPVVYGLLDTQFRKELCRLKDKVLKPCCFG